MGGAGHGRWRVDPGECGVREERGRSARESLDRAEGKRGRGLGRPGWAGAGLSWWAPWDGVWVVVFPFYFLFTILLTHTKLNSNKFESKNLFTQTNKEMLQHDATTKLNL